MMQNRMAVTQQFAFADPQAQSRSACRISQTMMLMAFWTALCLLQLSDQTPLPSFPNPETVMPNVVVPGAAEAGAVYPDNTPANYFINHTGSSGWIIHLSGGGWRFLTPSTPDGFTSSGMTSDGSTRATAEGHCYGKCDGILSDDPAQNPLFHTWNKVWIPISGTSFTGDRSSDKPYPVRGKRIQEAVIRDLQKRYGMAAATEVILTGGSSGGLATYLTCDRVGGLVAATNASTRYTCLADAGFFLDHPDIKGQPSTSPQFRESFVAWNSSGGTNQACVEHYTKQGTPEKCIFAEYVFPFIKSDIFIMQNLYDSWQINNILKIGCSGYNHPMTGCTAAQMAALEAYGDTMRQRLGPAIADPKVGMFTPSCIAHCQSVYNEHPAALWQWPQRWGIEGITPQQAFGAWYTRNKTGADTKHIQHCAWDPTKCNALCPNWT